MAVEKIPVYCSQCVAGPDRIEVEVENGVAKRIVPTFNFHEEHPAQGRVCLKAFGLIQKAAFWVELFDKHEEQRAAVQDAAPQPAAEAA